MAHTFADDARKMGELLIQAEDHEVYSGAAVEQLFGRTAQILGEHSREIVKNPKPLIKEGLCLRFLHPIFNVGRLVHAAYCDRDKIVQFFEQHNELFNTDPKEGVAQTMAFAIDFAITGVVIKKGSQFSSHTKKFLTLLEKETKIITPEIIQLCAARAAEWLKAIKAKSVQQDFCEGTKSLGFN